MMCICSENNKLINSEKYLLKAVPCDWQQLLKPTVEMKMMEFAQKKCRRMKQSFCLVTMQSFNKGNLDTRDSVSCQDIWKPSIGEFKNPMDKHAVKVVKGNEMVGHLPREFSWKALTLYFLACRGEISVEVNGQRLHCAKQLCKGMEILCQLELNCANKAQMKRLKELVVSKIQV